MAHLPPPVMFYVSYVQFHMSYFMCHMSYVTIFFFYFFLLCTKWPGGGFATNRATRLVFFLDKVVKLVSGWSIINGPIQNSINLFKVINLVWTFSVKLNLCLMERKDLARFNLKFQICHLFTFYNLVKSKYTNY